MSIKFSCVTLRHMSFYTLALYFRCFRIQNLSDNYNLWVHIIDYIARNKCESKLVFISLSFGIFVVHVVHI